MSINGVSGIRSGYTNYSNYPYFTGDSPAAAPAAVPMTRDAGLEVNTNEEKKSNKGLYYTLGALAIAAIAAVVVHKKLNINNKAVEEASEVLTKEGQKIADDVAKAVDDAAGLASRTETPVVKTVEEAEEVTQKGTQATELVEAPAAKVAEVPKTPAASETPAPGTKPEPPAAKAPEALASVASKTNSPFLQKAKKIAEELPEGKIKRSYIKKITQLEETMGEDDARELLQELFDNNWLRIICCRASDPIPGLEQYHGCPDIFKRMHSCLSELLLNDYKIQVLGEEFLGTKLNTKFQYVEHVVPTSDKSQHEIITYVLRPGFKVLDTHPKFGDRLHPVRGGRVMLVECKEFQAVE